jgi:hypothetical protein
MYLVYEGVNKTRFVPVILLCLMLVSVIYGFSVALSTSLNIQTLKVNCWVNARANNYHLLAHMTHDIDPSADPIDDPKPN